MLKESGKVEKWELPEISLHVNDDGNVILIMCRIYKEYYADYEGREELQKFTRKVKELVVK